MIGDFGLAVAVDRSRLTPSRDDGRHSELLLEFPFDTTRAVASLTFSGTLDRCSQIMFIVPHCGGTLPLAERVERIGVDRAPKTEQVFRAYLRQITTIGPLKKRPPRRLDAPTGGNVTNSFGTDWPAAREEAVLDTTKCSRQTLCSHGRACKASKGITRWLFSPGSKQVRTLRRLRIRRLKRKRVSKAVNRPVDISERLCIASYCNHRQNSKEPTLMPGPASVDKEIALKGLHLHYREWGSSQDPVLIILHGLNSHSWDRDFLASSLCDRYHVAVPDLRGHGDSDWADDYSWPRFQEDLDGLVTTLGEPQFTLLGYSVGGAIATAYAATHPETLSRLVVVENSPYPLIRERSPELVQMLQELQERRDFETPEEAVELWARYDQRASREAIRLTVSHNIKQLDSGRWTWRDDPHSRSRGGMDSRQLRAVPEERWRMLARIDCPTLLIYGESSEQNHAPAMAEMATLIPDCRVVGVDSTHRVHWDNPEALASAINAFLS